MSLTTFSLQFSPHSLLPSVFPSCLHSQQFALTTSSLQYPPPCFLLSVPLTAFSPLGFPSLPSLLTLSSPLIPHSFSLTAFSLPSFPLPLYFLIFSPHNPPSSLFPLILCLMHRHQHRVKENKESGKDVPNKGAK